MNATNMFTLREAGFTGHSVRVQTSNFWSKRNCAVPRFCSYYDEMRYFTASPSVSCEQSLREIYCTHMPHIWQERQIHVRHVNKIFASTWLNDNEIVMGTKCNKLLICVLNGKTGRLPDDSNRLMPLPTDRRYRKRDRWRRLLTNNTSNAPGTESSTDPADPNLAVFGPTRYLCPSGEILIRVPQLTGSHRSRWSTTHDEAMGAMMNSGMHTVKINPSNTIIMAGAHNPSDLAIYSLPDFKPLTVGEGAHSDWMFDFVWLDDQVGLSGSRDGLLAAWRFDADVLTDERHKPDCRHVPMLSVTDAEFYGTPAPQRYVSSAPLHTTHIDHFDRIRALSLSEPRRHVLATSLYCRLCSVDVCTLQKTMSLDLEPYRELVCMCHNHDSSAAVVGSRQHVSFFDDRTLEVIKHVPLPSNIRHDHHTGALHGVPGLERQDNQTGVRSVSWQGPLVTIGTGSSELLFFDVRTHKFVPCCGRACNRDLCLVATDPLTRYDEMFAAEDRINIMTTACAIYTHAYDASGTRLFAAGGPIAANVQGSYAALWS